MVSAWVLVGISIAAAGISLVLYFSNRRKLSEFSTKVHQAVTGKELMKIMWTEDGPLSEVSNDFNALGAELERLKNENAHLKEQGKDHESVKSKVSAMENSISNISMLTETGKQITARLKSVEIAKQLFKQIYSSLPSKEVVLLLKRKGHFLMYKISEKDFSVDEMTDIRSKQEQGIAEWCYANGQSAFLNDAETDYAQFLYQIPLMKNGEPVRSLFALPLNRGDEVVGAMAVYCDRKNAFEDYHLDMISSWASYTSLAVINAGLFGEVEEERKKSDALLLNILPEEIARELKEKGKAEARHYAQVTVLFTDFVNFTKISEQYTPAKLVSEIDYYFREFDRIMLKYGIEKIKTIGDAYMAVAGLPITSEDHAEKCVKAALEIIEFVNRSQQDGHPLHIRVGLNSGHVVAGVVGQSKYAFDIWGDTVNTAARMEQNSEAGRVNISGATFALVKDKFNVIHRGKINAKNKGEIDMYFVELK